jgi:hypothetical protein
MADHVARGTAAGREPGGGGAISPWDFRNSIPAAAGVARANACVQNSGSRA